ncbi:hypothetical protein JF781_13995 [Mycobacterium sp. WUMAC-067]|uniref:hypothetical protein n=1 Tax=unclassified Mycobacterium TaxID=2642494 RepID=UPI001CDA1DC2|nr:MULTISPECIES: hypothetical protein [unclassified Mycobacterium]MCA2243475.1 hypothetical protein [Mycobacterium sp. WUMAC-067]MCA2316148.1 hypothetical protein [Mycobacterium sp. WUMAC-025]
MRIEEVDERLVGGEYDRPTYFVLDWYGLDDDTSLASAACIVTDVEIPELIDWIESRITDPDWKPAWDAPLHSSEVSVLYSGREVKSPRAILLWTYFSRPENTYHEGLHRVDQPDYRRPSANTERWHRRRRYDKPHDGSHTTSEKRL